MNRTHLNVPTESFATAMRARIAFGLAISLFALTVVASLVDPATIQGTAAEAPASQSPN
jgi:hypothetical protein